MLRELHGTMGTGWCLSRPWCRKMGLSGFLVRNLCRFNLWHGSTTGEPLPHLARGVTIISMMTSRSGQGEAVLSSRWKIAWKKAVHCSVDIAPRPAAWWPSDWKKPVWECLALLEQEPMSFSSSFTTGYHCMASLCEAASSQLTGCILIAIVSRFCWSSICWTLLELLQLSSHFKVTWKVENRSYLFARDAAADRGACRVQNKVLSI